MALPSLSAIIVIDNKTANTYINDKKTAVYLLLLC